MILTRELEIPLYKSVKTYLFIYLLTFFLATLHGRRFQTENRPFFIV